MIILRQRLYDKCDEISWLFELWDHVKGNDDTIMNIYHLCALLWYVYDVLISQIKGYYEKKFSCNTLWANDVIYKGLVSYGLYKILWLRKV